MGPISLTFLVLAIVASLIVVADMLLHPALRRIGLRNFKGRKHGREVPELCSDWAWKYGTLI